MAGLADRRGGIGNGSKPTSEHRLHEQLQDEVKIASLLPVYAEAATATSPNRTGRSARCAARTPAAGGGTGRCGTMGDNAAAAKLAADNWLHGLPRHRRARSSAPAQRGRRRYKGQADAEGKLVAKLQAGGPGRLRAPSRCRRKPS